MDLVAWVVSLAALASGLVCRPRSSVCPVGWYDYDGVRRSGDFTCAPTPVGPDWEPMQPDRGTQPTPRLTGRVWCYPNAEPVVRDDGRTVECRRR